MPRKPSGVRHTENGPIYPYLIIDKDGYTDLRGFMTLWVGLYKKGGSVDDLVAAVCKKYDKHQKSKHAEFSKEKCISKMRKLIQHAEKKNKSGGDVPVPKALDGMDEKRETIDEVLEDLKW